MILLFQQKRKQAGLTRRGSWKDALHYKLRLWEERHRYKLMSWSVRGIWKLSPYICEDNGMNVNPFPDKPAFSRTSKQRRPWSDSSCRSCLIWVFSVCNEGFVEKFMLYQKMQKFPGSIHPNKNYSYEYSWGQKSSLKSRTGKGLIHSPWRHLKDIFAVKVDPDQTAAVWSGSTLFAYALSNNKHFVHSKTIIFAKKETLK